MDASKRMMLAKAMKEAPLGSSSPSPHSPEALQTPGSPLPIAAVPLVVASSPAPTPLGKGKRVLEISDDEDSDGVAPFKRRKSARVPLLPAASP